MKRIAVLVSNAGTGSNLQAIIDAVEHKKMNGTIAVVLSDTADAYGLTRAKKHKIPTQIVHTSTDIMNLLKKYHIDMIVLAGWKQIISDELIDAYPSQIINIHPGLIPDTIDGTVSNPDGSPALWNRNKFTEKAVQKFLQNNASFAGSTVHFLTHIFDFGPVLKRSFVRVHKGDTVKTLYARLKREEHRILVEALAKLCD